MHVISRKKLGEFWAGEPRAEPTLAAWFHLAERATWENFAAVKTTFSKADRVN
jgi:mRNA interferase HigB